MKASSRKGFSLVEIVLVVVFVAVIGLVSYKFWSASNSKSTTASAPATAADVATVKKAADLDTVSKQLDSVDVAGSFEKELDSASSF